MHLRKVSVPLESKVEAPGEDNNVRVLGQIISRLARFVTLSGSNQS